MNRIPKLVVSRSLTDLSAWENSTLPSGDLLGAVAEQRKERDLVGSASADDLRNSPGAITEIPQSPDPVSSLV
jgi:hypothetical protein